MICQHRVTFTINTKFVSVADADGDNVRCRWAESTLYECGEICRVFPAELSETSVSLKPIKLLFYYCIFIIKILLIAYLQCQLHYQATGLLGYYAVAVQIEDFASPTDTVPMSSVPLQFLVRVLSSSNTNCTSQPEFVGATRLDGSCVGVPFNTTWHESISARSGSSGVRLAVHSVI